jgi:hypothetical protein
MEKLTLLPIYGLSLMSYATKKIRQTQYKGMQLITVYMSVCTCARLCVCVVQLLVP